MAERIEDFECRGFQIVAISTDSREPLIESQANQFKDNEESPFTPLADTKMDAFRDYGAYDNFEKQALHAAFLISPDGRILWSGIAAAPFMDLDLLLKESRRLLKLHSCKPEQSGLTPPPPPIPEIHHQRS